MGEAKCKEKIAKVFSNIGVCQINRIIVSKRPENLSQFPDFPKNLRGCSYQSRLNAKARQKSKTNNGKVEQEPAPKPLKKRNSRYTGKQKKQQQKQTSDENNLIKLVRWIR